jgi:hypothetical protein
MMKRAAGGGDANQYRNAAVFLGDANLTSWFSDMFRHSGDS